MSGFTGVHGHRALSLGSLVIAGAVLALYQMTSLVLGPGGSRELHFSLTVPAVTQDEPSESSTMGNTFSLGTLVGRAPAASVRPASNVSRRASATPAPQRAAAPVPPVAPQPPSTHPSPSPLPPIVRVPDQQAGDDTD